MSKIFVSHSSENNAAALAVAKWLSESGWEDYFLDIAPSRGIAPGERWQEALRAAADRCEAVLFLISPAWHASRWCLAEFLLAKQLGKTIFGVLVEATPLDALPREMTTEWQLCDLVTGSTRRSFSVSQEPIVPETEVSFAADGLDRLRVGLQRAGLDPSTFPWPPHSEPERAPYRGLNALESEDAAVFFGREAAIVRGLDALRGSRERGVERLFVILGASGAGKSSFLRAGLWPRLSRDSRDFQPLPVVRPERAAISGSTGLAASLEAAFKERRSARSRAAINDALREPGGFQGLLAELQTLSTSFVEPDGSLPTIVIPVDQGEELFGAEGRAEAERLLALLALTLSSPEGGGAAAPAARRQALAIIAIRSDSFERLQTEPRLVQVAPYLFNLPPIARQEFKAIVEGPAKRHTSAGHSLEVDPALTERLVNDAEGADALPLLAFTLERLFVEHGGGGKLLLADYESMGGVRGSIEAGIELAFAEPGREPAVPADKAAREHLLRAGFIPWLARVDPQTEERKRRVARWEEVPTEARPLIERLIERRLLVRDRRRLEGHAEDVVVVEVAHEALLRQWPTLCAWLDEDAHALKILDAVLRAAGEWAKNRHVASSGETWLVHTGERLDAAEAVRQRTDFERILGNDGRSYLDACRQRDEKELRERRERAEREALADRKRLEAEAKTVRRTRMAAYLITIVAVIATGAAAFGWYEARIAARDRNQALAAQSKALSGLSLDQTDQGSATLGMLLALEALPGQDRKGDRPLVPHAEAALLYALLAQRERHVLTAHTGGVNQVRFSPQGSLVVTASRDASARLWNAIDGRPTIELKGHQGQVYGAEFSPDGRQVVTASSDKTARLWSVETGATVLNLAGHQADVYHASFSFDGRRVVTASGDGTACLWDARSGQLVFALQGHKGPVWFASFSADGKRVVTASDDQTSRLWDAETGRALAVLAGHSAKVYHAAFSPDGRRVVTASWDHTARVWDGLTGRLLSVLQGHQDGVSRATFSPDGALVVTTSADGTARLWNGATGAAVAVLQGHRGQVNDAQFSRDGRWLVTAADDGTARRWDVASHEMLELFRGHIGRVWSIRLSPDGELLVTGSEDTSARIWRVGSDYPLAELKGHGGHVNRASLRPDGQQVVTVSDDATGRIWNSESGAELAVLRAHAGGVWYAAYSSDGRHLVTTSADGTARLWDSDTQRLRHTLGGHKGLVNHADFSPQGTRLVTAGSEGTARVWDVESGKAIAVLSGHSGPVNFAAFSHSGQSVVTGSQDGTARLWRAETGAPIAVLEGHAGPIINGAVSPDDSRVITASWDGTARLWDGTSGKALVTLQGHTDAVLSAMFSPDGRLAVTGSSDNTARIWDVATGRPGLVLHGHEGEVYEATFSADGRLVLTASQDGTARLWHAASGVLVATLRGHRGPVVSAAFAPSGRQVVTASWDHTARLWKLPLGAGDDWVAYARKTAPRVLTEDERRTFLGQ